MSCLRQDPACQLLYPVVNIATNNNFEPCQASMYMTQFCQQSKVRFNHTSTTTRSHSCSEKITRTPRVHLVSVYEYNSSNLNKCLNIIVYSKANPF